MKSTKSVITKVCIAAVLTAAGVLLDRLLTVSTPAVKINLAFVPAAFGAVLLGPVYGAVIYGLTDLIGALLLPFGPYHPGFTVCAALMGFVYGMFLYETPVNINRLTKNGEFVFRIVRHRVRLFPNIITAVLINCLIIGLLVNTVWVSMLYGSKTYWGWFLYRLLEYAVLVPVQIIVLPGLLKISGGPKRRLDRL